MKRAKGPRETARLAAIAILLAIAGQPRRALAQQGDADVEIPAAPAKPPAAAQPPGPAPAQPPAAAKPPAPAPTQPSASPEIEALRQEMRAERAAFEARIGALEGELAKQKAHKAQAPAAPEAAPPPEAGVAVVIPDPVAPQGFGGPLFGRGAWQIGAYVQSQYEQHQNSDDQISESGAYLNQDRFLVRRGRLRLDAAWEFAELAIELDGNTTNGPAFGAKRLNASLVWWGRPWDAKIHPKGPRDSDMPLLRLTGGLTKMPFGFDFQDAPNDRVLMERSTALQAFFPGEEDVGAVLSGGVGPFRYAVAAMNGNPLGTTPAIPVGDPNHAKDFIARLGAEGRPSDRLRVAGGVSALYGTGFHAGTPATKASLVWNDTNQNGVIDQGSSWACRRWPRRRRRTSRAGPWASTWSCASAPASAGRCSTARRRSLPTSTAGSSWRDPITTGVDVRELGGYAALVQEIFGYGLVGFRFDYYDPNADFARPSGGQLLPVSQAIQTFSPLVGVQIPDRARLLFEYDVVRNNLGVGTNGVPTNLPEDHFTIRLQVQL